MRDKPLHKAVLDDLGPEQLHQVADELGTGSRGAKRVVGETVAALTGSLAEEAASPHGAHEVEQALDEAQEAVPAGPGVRRVKGSPALAGAVPFSGGALGGGMLATIVGRTSMPVARAVSQRTGIPMAQVSRALKILTPIAMAAVSRAAQNREVRADGLAEMLTAERQATRRPGGALGALARLFGGGQSYGGGRHRA
ncbi:DUF937 domain-containing protein [Streptomyces sp. WMMC500]|uniref:DUF937 domain-containing protein n=1 Tax=Streptomyces sp. WMMC500 TaxID=3015154 RepID=UPI00248B5EF0|nr:DUF937 domain-containing protein [Streptomyces sp. WMMC500]WBB59215.1 DUF937 domain-containing protein [Streptomyces sp. WMMC500]